MWKGLVVRRVGLAGIREEQGGHCSRPGPGKGTVRPEALQTLGQTGIRWEGG